MILLLLLGSARGDSCTVAQETPAFSTPCTCVPISTAATDANCNGDLLNHCPSGGDPDCFVGDNSFPDCIVGEGGCTTVGGECCVAAPGAFLDPHIRGPHFEEFDFEGQPDGVYTMFTSPTVTVNAKMLKEGPKERYMSEIFVMFRNLTMTFDVYGHPGLVEKYNAALEPFGGKARYNPQKMILSLDLCPGHTFTIQQVWEEKDGGKYYFLNLGVEIRGCHDGYGGVVGQLYQCKFEKTRFAWDAGTEESFRVDTLHSIGKQFVADATCPQVDQFAQKSSTAKAR